MRKDAPGIVPGAGGAPVTIFAVKTGKVVTPATGKAWAVSANPMYEYWFEYPTEDWVLSIPAEYSAGRARLLESRKCPSVAILVLPFGLYDNDEISEIEKAENGYLGPNVRDGDRVETQGDKKFYYRTYTCVGPEATEPKLANAVFIVARPKCFAIFMRGTEAEMKLTQPVFERVVKSFHLDKTPMRDPKARPFQGEKSPAASSSATPSPAASSSAAPSPEASASVRPSSAPSPSQSPSAQGAAGSETGILHQTEGVLQSYLDPDRDQWQQSDRILGLMELRPGQTVADIGAGSGYFTYRFSRAVGATGRVYAVDTDPNAIRFLRHRMEQDTPPFPNIELLQSACNNVGLKSESLDWAFTCEGHFMVRPDPGSLRCLRTIYDALRPGGRMAVIEAREDPLRGKVSVELLQQPFLRLGFQMVGSHDFLEREHFIILSKPATTAH